MEWYLHIIVYFFAGIVSFVSMWQVDFNKFIRSDRKDMAIIVYVVLSLALTFLVGRLLIEVGEAIDEAND